MQLRTALFLLLIIWQFANYNALQNQSAITKGKQDLDATENISTNTSSHEQKSFYRYEPEIFMRNESGSTVPKFPKPRVLTEKVDIDVDRSMELLKQQLIKFTNKPIVLLVDETHAAFKDAVHFGESFFKMPDIRTEFRLMVFNASGKCVLLS